MSLLENAKSEVQGTAVAAEGAKKHSNSEYQKKARAKALASAQLLKKELSDKKVVLSPEAQEALAYLCKEGRAVGGSGVFGKPVIYKLFGDEPKVGAKITATKVFEETGKGFAEMRQLMKKWKEKSGVEVIYDADSKSYVLKAGTIAKYGA
jgi:hypothetical protein